MAVKIAIQGDEGSNHDLITRKLWSGSKLELELLSAKSFPILAEKLAKQEADIGVMAIENTIAGDILGNYDLLSKYDLTIIAEGYLRIEHCLIGLPESDLGQIRAAYSHEMALKQCFDFLDTKNIEAREYFDTAAAVAHIKQLSDPSIAAIAPSIAAEVYGGKVLQAGIETDKQNYTRFLVVVPKHKLGANHLYPIAEVTSEHTDETKKVGLEFVVAHEPGSLLNVLGDFAQAKFNLTKIVSRPIIGKPWEYRFYVDFISNASIDGIRTSLEQLAKDAVQYRVFGIYPIGKTFQP